MLLTFRFRKLPETFRKALLNTAFHVTQDNRIVSEVRAHVHVYVMRERPRLPICVKFEVLGTRCSANSRFLFGRGCNDTNLDSKKSHARCNALIQQIQVEISMPEEKLLLWPVSYICHLNNEDCGRVVPTFLLYLKNDDINYQYVHGVKRDIS